MPRRAIALLFVLSVSAAQAGDIKIGFIDMARVLRESAPALAAQKKLEKEFAPRDLALQRTAQQLENLRTSPGKNSAMVSGAENRKEGRDILTLDRDFQRARQTLGEDLARRRNEELAGVIGRVNRAVKVIAEAEGLDAVFQEAAFANARIDVTDRVLKTLLLGADE